jgi:hypothetical protein
MIVQEELPSMKKLRVIMEMLETEEAMALGLPL